MRRFGLGWLPAGGVLVGLSCSFMINEDAISGGAGAAGAAGAAGGLVCEDDSHRDCDGDPENGCEAAVATDRNNCGDCGVVCAVTEHAAEIACTDGDCTIVECVGGAADCNRSFDDGCEVDLATSEEHCGACNRLCLGTCVNGFCDSASSGSG